jgi:hypothetical protein
MNNQTYTLTIKKDYAFAKLEALMLDDAIELIPNIVPEWQITESLRRLAEMKSNPSSMIDEKDFFNSVDVEA